MDLGSHAGGPERLCQMLFVRGNMTAALHAIRTYTDGLASTGLAETRLVAPFFATRVGTDTYVDELW
jgi:hypothetical protein